MARDPEMTLRVELSDVCPCDVEGCATPHSRWRALTRGLPERPSRAAWPRLRDHHHLTNPRTAREDDYRAILHSAFHGTAS